MIASIVYDTRSLVVITFSISLRTIHPPVNGQWRGDFRAVYGMCVVPFRCTSIISTNFCIPFSNKISKL